ncbi:MAG: HD domain-containing protein [Candidatus Nealsonbacteria bacterium]|nr:HD domain-containing protein [Candidatus Nealsonbacteria bacterium]
MLIPKEVKSIINKLEKAGFEAYVVGGCARDFLQDREPNDWDVTTSAVPEQIQKIFPDNFYENRFLTVTVQTQSKDPKLKEIEITTFRSEAKYSDKRHPDEINFAQTLEEDLARRDFTINAIALKLRKGVGAKSPEIIDPFSGQADLKKKIVRAAGNPNDRFSEDALRLMRAVRLATVLKFSLEEKTRAAIVRNAPLLKLISIERIRDEFVKIIESEKAADGVELLRRLGLLKYVVPELEEGVGCGQNKHHIYDCYEHNLFSLKYAATKNFNLAVRLAALFHDIAKPRVKKGEGPEATFYGHEIVGARLTAKILERLRLPRDLSVKVVRLVRYHLFYYNVGEVGESSVRRLLRNAGPENIEELLQVRYADRIGSGVPKAEPYKLRHLRYLMARVSTDPISAKMLKVNGHDVMEILKISPSPKVGQILDILLGQILEDPKKNKKEALRKEVVRLGRLSDKELDALAREAEKGKEQIEQKRDEMTKEKYWVT